MVLELYLDLLCRAVYIFAKKNNIPFMMKTIEMLKGQQFSEEFNKVNILRKVPVLKDGDYTLEECTAILLYLTRKYNTASHWYPPDMKKQGQVDEYLAWQHNTIRASASKILWHKVVIPLFLDQQVPPEKLHDAMEDLNLALQKLEKFLQDKPFLIGTEISLADLVAIVELMQWPEGACQRFTRLRSQSPLRTCGGGRPRKAGKKRAAAGSRGPKGRRGFPSAGAGLSSSSSSSAGGTSTAPSGAGHAVAGSGGVAEQAAQRRRDALRGAGDESAGGALVPRPAGQAVLGGGGRPGQARGEGERDGEERAADGAGWLRRALRPAGRRVHRRGELGGAEPGAQRPPLRLPHAGAGARRRQDPHSVLSPGTVADRQEWNRHDFLVRRPESVRQANSP